MVKSWHTWHNFIAKGRVVNIFWRYTSELICPATAERYRDLLGADYAEEHARALCDLMWPHMRSWTPQFAN